METRLTGPDQAARAAWRARQTTWSVRLSYGTGQVAEHDRMKRQGRSRRGMIVALWWLVAVDPAAKTATVVREGERRVVRLHSTSQVAAFVRALEARRRLYALWTGRRRPPAGLPFPDQFHGPAPDPVPGEPLGLR